MQEQRNGVYKVIGKKIKNKQAFLKIVGVFSLFLFSVVVYGQKTVDLENLPNPTQLTLSGNVGANSIFYNSNQRSAREPFTYVLQGSITANWLSFSMPISYVLTNQGDDFSSQIPYRFDRLSLNPKYKWISAYVGDASLSFSPYSYNGHQFTGLGAELTPADKPYKIKFFGGQMLRAVEDDGDDFTQPTYQRMGYGIDFLYEKEQFSLGVNTFYAKDNDSSVNQTQRMDSLSISPGENFVLGFSASKNITQRLVLKGQYANSFLTNDTRINNGDSQNSLAGVFIDGNGSSQNKHAYNMALDYKFDRMDVGFAYERIAPGYETFGAYFFNNDFENITFNASRNFFDDALQIKTNFGLQRDDLNNQKVNSTTRNIAAIDGTLALGRLNLSGGYSNFTTFTNAKLNRIEQNTDQALQNVIDSTDYRQLSQNAFVNADFILTEKDAYTQNINFGYNLSSSANEQDGLIFPGQANNFHNFNTGFIHSYTDSGLSIAPSFNYVYSDLGFEDAKSWGLDLTISKPFFDNKLNSDFTATHNNAKANGTANRQTILQLGTTLVVKEQHNFSMNATQLFSMAEAQENLQEFTLSFGYNYSFTPKLKSPNLPKLRRKEKEKKEEDQTKKQKPKQPKPAKETSVAFKNQTLKGDVDGINKQINKILEDRLPEDIPDLYATDFNQIKKELAALEKAKNPNSKQNSKAQKLLLSKLEKTLADYEQFNQDLSEFTKTALAKLKREANETDKLLKDEILQETIARAKQTKSKTYIPYVVNRGRDRVDLNEYNGGKPTAVSQKLKVHYKILDGLEKTQGSYDVLMTTLKQKGSHKHYLNQMAEIYNRKGKKEININEAEKFLADVIFKLN